jgi:hypothetical protein
MRESAVIDNLYDAIEMLDVRTLPAAAAQGAPRLSPTATLSSPMAALRNQTVANSRWWAAIRCSGWFGG